MKPETPTREWDSGWMRRDVHSRIWDSGLSAWQKVTLCWLHYYYKTPRKRRHAIVFDPAAGTAFSRRFWRYPYGVQKWNGNLAVVRRLYYQGKITATGMPL